MAITGEGHKALLAYIDEARYQAPSKRKIYQAVVLTEDQVRGLTAVLEEYWGREYPCPQKVDIQPLHGYQSRVIKDGFGAEQYVEWLVAACSDVSEVAVEPNTGRPRLVLPRVVDEYGRVYDLIIPLGSDSHGRVYINDVIPKGLRPKHKKTAPSANP